MKKMIIILLFCCSSMLLGQSKEYLQTLETFTYHFNNGDDQSIYDMWDSQMQGMLSPEATKNVMEQMREAMGNITAFEFQESKGVVEKYLARFQNGEKSVSLSLDGQEKISGLRFDEVVTHRGNPRYQMAIQGFTRYFNEGNPEGIHAMFSPAMKKQLSQELLEQVIETYKAQLGAIKSTEYKETQGPTEVHLATFDNGKQNILITVNNEDQLTGLRFTAPADNEVRPKMERNKTPMRLPFKGNWFTVWGGDTKAQNYHVISTSQRRAFDFLIIGKGNKTYERSGTRNEDYYAFGQPIYAVCDAEVIKVITGVNDNKPGEMNPAQAFGNSVTLKTANGEYIVYAHFRKGTLKVKEGDIVRKGQILGECGNSGNSSEPHLHFHLQDGPKMLSAIGFKCYFEQVVVKGEIKKDYSPVRLDGVSLPEN